MNVELQQEHRWLDKLVGAWTYEAEATMELGKPPVKFKGTDNVRSIGGLWVQCEGTGETPGGGTATSLMTIGYDPTRKHFVGTFLHSMGTHLWIYDGALDSAGRVLTLDAEGPSMAGDGSMAKYQDIIEFLSDDHRTLNAQVLGPDGTWNRFMTAHYRRTT